MASHQKQEDVSSSKVKAEWIQSLASSTSDDTELLALFQSQYKYTQKLTIIPSSMIAIRTKEGIYFGSVSEEKKKSGLGVLCYFNGRIYEGEWKNDKKHGKGAEVYSNGGMYLGKFQDGKRQGKGQFKWPNGEVYDGEWKAGQKHGSGLWRGFKGDSYIGEWKEGKTDGFGVHTWINGDRYEGQFRECLKNGQGTEKFGNGDTYTGNYKLGKPDGFGEYKWINGNSYKGEFQDGLRHGKGMWCASQTNGGDTYDGEYFQDQKNGYGEYKWLSGNVYKGNFEGDLRHGYGEFKYPDGTIQKGYWMKGILIGKIKDQTIEEVLKVPEQSQSISDESQKFKVNHFQPKYVEKKIRYSSHGNNQQRQVTLPLIPKAQNLNSTLQRTESPPLINQKNIKKRTIPKYGQENKTSKSPKVSNNTSNSQDWKSSTKSAWKSPRITTQGSMERESTSNALISNKQIHPNVGKLS